MCGMVLDFETLLNIINPYRCFCEFTTDTYRVIIFHTIVMIGTRNFIHQSLLKYTQKHTNYGFIFYRESYSPHIITAYVTNKRNRQMHFRRITFKPNAVCHNRTKRTRGVRFCLEFFIRRPTKSARDRWRISSMSHVCVMNNSNYRLPFCVARRGHVVGVGGKEVEIIFN